jgi:hypothetical protein
MIKKGGKDPVLAKMKKNWDSYGNKPVLSPKAASSMLKSNSNKKTVINNKGDK